MLKKRKQNNIASNKKRSILKKLEKNKQRCYREVLLIFVTNNYSQLLTFSKNLSSLKKTLLIKQTECNKGQNKAIFTQNELTTT